MVQAKRFGQSTGIEQAIVGGVAAAENIFNAATGQQPIAVSSSGTINTSSLVMYAGLGLLLYFLLRKR